MRTITWPAYGLIGATTWLKMPTIPKAPRRAVIARTSGTQAATRAPNAMSRMRNVAGRLIRSAPSRSRSISSATWPLRSVVP